MPRILCTRGFLCLVVYLSSLTACERYAPTAGMSQAEEINSSLAKMNSLETS